MLYVDIPTTSDLKELLSHRGDLCVSIYLPTTPITQETQADRIELKNLAKQAVQQLQAAGAQKRRITDLAEYFDDLIDDDEFWRFQAHSLAVFSTADNIRTFRLPNALSRVVEVSDRFHLKPLLRAVTFPNACYVLALSEGAVRLVEVSADLPAAAVKVDGMPKNAGDAVRRANVNDRSPSGRFRGLEGQKVLLHQFARKVDGALRSLLAGSDLPLVLAATQPMAAIYRTVNTYAHLATTTIAGNPDALTEAQLAERARPVLDGLYNDEITAFRELYENRDQQGRATTDIAQAARAATFGAVEAMLMDIDEVIPGKVDETNGRVAFAERADADNYGVVDEIAGRVIASGGRVLGVRKADIPGGKSLAAIMRYAA